MCAINRVHYGPVVVFVCLHITLPHYHHSADVSEGVELLTCLSGTWFELSKSFKTTKSCHRKWLIWAIGRNMFFLYDNNCPLLVLRSPVEARWFYVCLFSSSWFGVLCSDAELTHWPLGDLNAIPKMEFSILFYWLESSDLLMIMPSDECVRTLLMIRQHWFR